MIRYPTNAQDPAGRPEQAKRDEGYVAVPFADAANEYHASEIKPRWRGWIHLGTFPLAVAAGIVLVVFAQGVAATLSSAVFALSSLALFGVSATYHRFTWPTRTKAILRRLDHSNIFFLIAGTYTPIATLALVPTQGTVLLTLVWSGALLGVGLRVFWLNAPRWIYVPLYLLLGWAAVMYTPQLFDANPIMMILVVAGGLLYTVGAVVYATKWPNPSAQTFGFHEIFHAFTVLAFFCHWTAVFLIAVSPPL